MKWFYDLKISTKLIIGFLIVALIGTFIGYMGYSGLNKVNTQVTNLGENNLPSILSVFTMKEALTRVDGQENGLAVAALNQSERDAYYAAIADAFKRFDDAKATYTKLPQAPDEAIAWNSFVPAVEKFRAADQEFQKLCKQYDSDKSEANYTKMLNYGIVVTSAALVPAVQFLDQVVESNKQQAATSTSDAKKVCDSTLLTIIVTIVAGLLLSIIIGIVLSNIISRPINILVAAADKLSLGDVDVNIISKTKDEIGLLMASMSKMVEAIKDQVNATEKIAAGDLSVTVKVKSDKDILSKKLVEMQDTIKAILNEMNNLLKETQEGKLDTRGNAQAFQGDWAELIKGLNGLLDGIMEPIQEVQAVLEEMAQGNLNISVKGNYKGDHAKTKKALNDTISTLYSYVDEIAKVLTEMADGNLNVEIVNDYKGDFAPIKNSLNNIINSLNEVLSDMNNASIQVASGARQVSDSAQALSQGSTEQASSIEELTASMEEISTQTQQNAANANQANELALAAKEGAVKGNEQMKGMLKSMDDINEASGNIFKIIKVIDEIAFQTNILALNAAVEAARAGQHGKGFAVVAEEVRNLAARSANAAKETTALIEGSMKKVEGGTKIASDTAAALNQIVEGVSKATNLVGEIATASNEQALGINQVNQGIMQVSSVVQTNSATSEESAAASEELSSQAERLREQVSRFKLKKTTESSYRGFDELNPGVLRMLEEMSQKKKDNNDYVSQGYAEVATTSSKPKISLSNNDFGKY